jgi:hypothetical protein
VRAGILAHRLEDGGFRGRSGGSDAWYTAFALRVLELTGGIPEAISRSAAAWRLRLPPPASVRDGLDQATIAALTGSEAMPPPDPPAGVSAYDAFALAVSADLRGLPIPRTDLSSLRRGLGYAETPAHPQAQVPATAAALTAGLLAGMRDLPACDFLLGQQTPGGGMLVHAGAPVADLLSTATTAWALAASRQLHRADRAGLARFALSCRTPDGFAAIPGDHQSDPEYAWYGLTLLALLRRHAAPGPVGWLRRRGWWQP